MMPDTDVLAHLDWQTLGCQCDQHICTSRGGCTNPATMQIEFHALDHCNTPITRDGDTLNPYGNYVYILCRTCFEDLEQAAYLHIRNLNQWGRKTCLTCGAPACKTADVIREVKTL